MSVVSLNGDHPTQKGIFDPVHFSEGNTQPNFYGKMLGLRLLSFSVGENNGKGPEKKSNGMDFETPMVI